MPNKSSTRASCPNHRHRKTCWLLLALLIGWLGSIGSVAAAVWIEYYDGERDAYRLMRDDERLPVAIYQDLQPGDRLSVEQAGISLWLKHDDGSTDLITQRNSPHRIQDTGRAPGLLDRLLVFAGEYLSIGLEDGSARPTIVTAGSRGDEPAPPLPLYLPFASTGSAYLAEGQRPLHLFWIGGVPPIQLRLLREGETEPLLALTLRELAANRPRRLVIPAIPLEAGSYLLELRDAHRPTRLKLQVIATNQLPRPEQALGPDEQDPTRANLYALWLAAQGHKWLLEAYQRASLIGRGHRPAQAFAYSLEAGRHPPVLPIR